MIRIREGATYSPLAIDTTISRMEAIALKQGVDFVNIEPRIARNEQSQTLDVVFAVTKGPRVFVERIDIEGNATTLDKVVRRQFKTVEGDPFNPREIREAAERIRALGKLETADVNARRAPPQPGHRRREHRGRPHRLADLRGELSSARHWTVLTLVPVASATSGAVICFEPHQHEHLAAAVVGRVSPKRRSESHAASARSAWFPGSCPSPAMAS